MSLVSFDFSGKGEVKGCTAGRVGGSPQAPAVRFQDGTADPESHAGPLRLGSKKRIKDLIRVLWREAHAGIGHRDQHLIILAPLRLDSELARAIRVFHRVDAVDHEVHEHLLQLHMISHDLRKECSEIRPDQYAVLICLAVQKKSRLSNSFVYIDQLLLQSVLLEELADTTDDLCCTSDVLNGSGGSFARLREIRRIPHKPS